MSNPKEGPVGSRFQRRQELKRRERRKTRLSYGLGLLGVVALLALIIFVPKQVMLRETFDYTDSDLVYGESLHAEHEMEGAKLAAIPFLPKDSPQPKIQATHLYYDLGSVGSQEVVTHQIALKNVGQAPLTIARAYTTCGCTTAHIDASELQPGDVTLVTVILDLGYHDVRGQTVRRGVIIESNDPSSPELTFWMQAKVRTTP